MSRLFLRFSLVLLLFFGVATAASSRDLRLTPNQVFSIWVNIDDCLEIVADLTLNSDHAKQTFRDISLKTYKGKEPGDVLLQVVVFRDRLNQLREQGGQSFVSVYEPRKTEIVPRDVYMNSGHIQDALIESMIVEKHPELFVSQFYTRHHYTDKTPSDVFAMVELANRKLEFIFADGELQ